MWYEKNIFKKKQLFFFIFAVLGTQYWNLKWGMKYCKKYAEPAVFSAFTLDGQKFLNMSNQCLGVQLEKIYKTEKTLKCKAFHQNVFKMQGKCYADNLEVFCKAFPENKVQFNKLTDMKDNMDQNFLAMMKTALGKCTPPIDLFSLSSF
jgi:hypothetical protein